MKRRRSMTYEEHLRELKSDPERYAQYLATIEARDRRLAAFAEEFREEDERLAREARTLGYKISSVWDFVNNTPHPILPRPFVGPYERAYPLLVRHLRLPHHQRVREGIIRALIVKDGGPLVAAALLEQFVTEKDRNLRWLLAIALRAAMSLKERRKHPEIGLVLKRAL